MEVKVVRLMTLICQVAFSVHCQYLGLGLTAFKVNLDEVVDVFIIVCVIDNLHLKYSVNIVNHPAFVMFCRKTVGTLSQKEGE